MSASLTPAWSVSSTTRRPSAPQVSSEWVAVTGDVFGNLLVKRDPLVGAVGRIGPVPVVVPGQRLRIQRPVLVVPGVVTGHHP